MNKSKKLLIISIWILLCASFGYFLPKIPFFKDLVGIKVVQVVGTDKIKKKDLIDIFSHQNWFFVDEEDVKNELLKRYKIIKKIYIKRLFVGTINIYVVERQPIAVIYYKGKKYTVDKDGVILEGKFDDKNLTKIYIYSKNEKLKLNFIQKIIDLNYKLSKNFKLKKIILNNKQISFLTSNDKILVFKTENIYSQINKMEKFIKKVNIENYKYLNFSFDSMIIARR